MKKNNKLFRKFFFSYFLIFVISLLMTFLIYNYSFKMLSEKVNSSNKELIDYCAEIIDIEIKNIDNIVDYFSYNLDITAFTNLSYTDIILPEDYYKVIKASYPIQDYPLYKTLLFDFLIYSYKNNSILTNQRVHTDIKREYEYFLKWNGFSYDEWKDKILNGYYNQEFLPEVSIYSGKAHPNKVIPYITSIPINSKGHTKANIIAYIDLEKFQDILSRINRGEEGSTYVLDKNNNILTQIGFFENEAKLIDYINFEKSNLQEINVNNNKYYVTQNTSDETGIKIISFLPKSYIANELVFIKRIFLVVIGVSIIIGLFLSLYFTYIRTKPIIEIAKIARENLDEQNKNVNTYDVIKKSLKDLIEDNKELSDYQKKQILQNRNLFLEKLLEGQIFPDENVQEQLLHYEIKLEHKPYNVIIAKILGFGDFESKEIMLEKDLINIIIKDELLKHSKTKGYFIQKNKEDLVYIFEDSYKKDIVPILSQIIFKLEENNKIKVIFSIGNITEDLQDISVSYGQANYAMKYLEEHNDKKVISYEDIPTNNDSVYFPIEIENKIIFLATHGYPYKISTIFNSIYFENFEQKNLSEPLKNQIVSSLAGTYIRILNQESMNITPFCVFHNIKKMDTYLDKISFIEKGIINIAEGNCGKVKEKDFEIKREITQYIENNLSNPLLNLNMVANKFDYKESYIYHFFIDKFKKSFASYVEEFRIEKAKDLLKSNKISISDIAENCGYGSSHSFRRAFKRVLGLTPSEYRESLVS